MAINAQSPMQWPTAQLQRYEIRREGLKQLLQAMAAGKGAVELNHQTALASSELLLLIRLSASMSQ
jgi:hypothetical protein